jgi:hypothetical protein
VLIKKPVAVGNGVQVNPTSQPIAMAPTISQKIEVNMELNGNQVKQLREALQSAGQCKVLCREKRTFLPLEAWNVRKWLKYNKNPLAFRQRSVNPIILRPVDWKDTPFSKLQVLPKDAKPVTKWSDRDTAFVDVVQGIRRAVDSLADK